MEQKKGGESAFRSDLSGLLVGQIGKMVSMNQPATDTLRRRYAATGPSSSQKLGG
jgi:hypothetical protein